MHCVTPSLSATFVPCFTRVLSYVAEILSHVARTRDWRWSLGTFNHRSSETVYKSDICLLTGKLPLNSLSQGVTKRCRLFGLFHAITPSCGGVDYISIHISLSVWSCEEPKLWWSNSVFLTYGLSHSDHA